MVQEKDGTKEESRGGEERGTKCFFYPPRQDFKKSLVEAHGLAHSRLDVERAHVLPVLLQERDQEVDRHLDVDVELLLMVFSVSFFGELCESFLFLFLFLFLSSI